MDADFLAANGEEHTHCQLQPNIYKRNGDSAKPDNAPLARCALDYECSEAAKAQEQSSHSDKIKHTPVHLVTLLVITITP